MTSIATFKISPKYWMPVAKILKALRLLKASPALISAVNGGVVRSNETHAKLAGDWLLRCQAVTGGQGYAHSFGLGRGWGKPYPETTGYLVPTLLRLAKYLDHERYAQSATDAGLWLLKIQQSDGAFADLDGRKQIFDTGQIIEGLVALYHHTGNDEFLWSARKASQFIISMQNQDGSWTRCSYNGIAHSYYTRVAANLMLLAEYDDKNRLQHCAERALHWARKQQLENGYFEKMSFDDASLPYLHTIIYVLEGFLNAYIRMGEKRFLDIVVKTVDALIENLDELAALPYAQYDADWKPPRKEMCLVGTAQWAGLLVDLSALRAGKRERYLRLARIGIEFLKSRQVDGSVPDTRGAIPGSWPIWGSYFRYSFNNWTAKFFLDALMKIKGDNETCAA